MPYRVRCISTLTDCLGELLFAIFRRVSPDAVGLRSTWKWCVTIFTRFYHRKQINKRKKAYGKFDGQILDKQGEKTKTKTICTRFDASLRHTHAHTVQAHTLYTAMGQRNYECECHIGLRVWTTDRRPLRRQQQQVIENLNDTHLWHRQKKKNKNTRLFFLSCFVSLGGKGVIGLIESWISLSLLETTLATFVC